MPLELQDAEENGVAIVAAVGQIDSRTAPELEARLNKLLSEKKREILLDLTRLDYVASAGLRIFVMVGKRLQAEGGRLALCALNPSVHKVLEVSGFLDLFPIRSDRADALVWLNDTAKASRVSALAGEILGREGRGAAPRPAKPADSKLGDYAADLLRDRTPSDKIPRK
jgi:stage II sporulation protein AA (anti-sigma F factor antagonist)